jgi:rubredoxin
MTLPLCANPACRTRNRHQPGCPGDPCGGCLPRPADYGLRLCRVCTTRLGEDAVQAAELHAELAERLLAGTGMGERVAGTSEARTPKDAVMDARSDIAHFLTWWTRLIVQERGIHPPVLRSADDVDPLGLFVARHATWLAAHRWASYAATELHDIAHGAPWRIYDPAGTRVFGVPRQYRCPECGAELRAVIRLDSQLLPPEVTCDGPDVHVWKSYEWKKLGDRISAETAA